MLAANARSVPFKPDAPEAVWRRLGRFLRRLAGLGPTHAPDLPDDLRGDVGLGEAMPLDRQGAFWKGQSRSHARDLPL